MYTRNKQDHTYTGHIEWTGNTGDGTADYSAYGREYRVDFEEKPSIVGTADPAFRGRADLHNPEELFVASVSACHMLFWLSLCARHGIRALSYEDRPTGTLELNSAGGGRFRAIVLRPVATIADGDDADLALRLHDVANERCFIANSCGIPIRHEAEVRSETGTTSHPPAAVAPGVPRLESRVAERADGSTAESRRPQTAFALSAEEPESSDPSVDVAATGPGPDDPSVDVAATEPRMIDLAIELSDRPGALAAMGEALGRAGVSIEGGGAWVAGGRGVAHFLFLDGSAARHALEAAGIRVLAERSVVVQRLDQGTPGQLGLLTRRMADAGVNIEVLYSDHDHRLILVVDDEDRGQAVSSSWDRVV